MVLFPNCKINLGLNIVRKRTDGYHDLETVFYPLAIQDGLEIVRGVQNGEDIQYSTSGLIIEGRNESNLCLKAYQLIKKNFPQLPPIKMHLHKTVPVGSGLGGGSADGAFTLKLLNQMFGLGLSTEQLLDCALQLGSDCPFFVINKPCFAAGRGEILEPIQVDLSAYKFMIVNPRIHISTAEVFSLLIPVKHSKSIKITIGQPVNTWRGSLENDFEAPVFDRYPEIKKIKEKLYEAGAIYASMSGSGSTVYGIFEEQKKLSLSFPSNYFTRELVSHL